METAIVTGVFGLITAFIGSWFTSRSKNKEIELQREINEKEIQTLKGQHQHDLDKINLEHQHELDKMETEKRTQLELNSQTGIDGLMQQQFAKQFDDPDSPMSQLFNNITQEEFGKLTSKSKSTNSNSKRNKKNINRNN